MNNPKTYLAEIAADALEQLRMEKLIPMKGTYLRIQGDPEGGTQPNAKVGAFTENACVVCAKGALFLSHLRREPDDTPVGYVTDGIEELENLLGKNLELIEACFEGWNYSGLSKRYASHFSDSHSRLEAILENIVRNEGVFIPQQDLEAVSA